ncbi:MAG: ATP-binding protein [Nitrospirota bacterium]
MEIKTNTSKADANPDNTKITITLPTNAYFMSGIRDFTLNMIKNTTNFPEKWAFRFQSVVDELCNNAIEYGSAPGSEIRITFLHKKDDFIEIFVEDTGTGKNRINATQLQKLFDERKTPGYEFTGIRGRGLVKIVGEWTDELKFEDRPEGGIKITAKKYIKNARQNEAGISEVQNQLVIN